MPESRRSPSSKPTSFWLKLGFFFLFALAGILLGVLYAHLRELPDITNLIDYKPAQTTRIYDSNGNLISQLALEQRTIIPLEQVPQNLQNAVIGIEDERFYRHWGIDPIGIARAFLINVRHGGTRQGASTITQQLARNLFLTSERTMARKIREALLSFQIERNFTKKQILEMYMNQIYYGEGAYGVESASRTYFGKHAMDLSLAECAMMAGLPKAPSTYSPYKNPLNALSRRNIVLNRMADLGFISLQQATEAKNEPLELKKIEVQNAPYFVEYVRQQLEATYGANAVYKGGMIVFTTLDMKMQDTAQKTVNRGIEEAEKRARRLRQTSVPITQPIQGALLAIDPHTGAIRAMVGGRDYRSSVFNRTVQANRQPGSAFKPIIYAAAIENGYTMSDVILDAPIVYPDPVTGREWRPANYTGKFRGPTTLHTALMFSINVVTIKLLEKLGTGPVVNLARRLGLSSAIAPNLSLGLGTSEVTMLEMVQAFSVFANQGVRVEPYAIQEVKDSSGRLLESHTPAAQEVLDPQMAYIMVNTLKDVIDKGTGRIVSKMGFTRPAAGKTGTTNNNIDAWFIGFTPQLSCGVWLGYDERQSLGPKQTGGTAAAPIWASFMKEVHVGIEVKDFVMPDNIVSKKICVDTGLTAGPRCYKSMVELFKKDTAPIKSCHIHGGGTGATSLDSYTSSSDAPALDILEMEAHTSYAPVAPTSADATQGMPTPTPAALDSYEDEGF
jgi:penicillin-binding protein 1A